MSHIPEGFGEIVVTYAQSGTIRPAQWTIGLNVGPTGNEDADLDAIITSWGGTGNVLNPAQFDARLTVVSIRMTVMRSTGPVIYERAVTIVGTRAGDAQPPNVAVLFRRATNRGGRRGRGRLYLPSGYLSEADVVEGGSITGARYLQLVDMGLNIRSGVSAGLTTDAYLLHNDDVVPPDELTSIAPQVLVATMRRRLRK